MCVHLHACARAKPERGRQLNCRPADGLTGTSTRTRATPRDTCVLCAAAALTAPPAERQTGAHFTGLYATIPATLTLLSRVYLCIDRTVFDGLATEARHA